MILTLVFIASWDSLWQENNSPANVGDLNSILGCEDPLEKEMATHSSVLAWEIPWIEEPGRLQSMGLQSRTRLSD